MLRRVTYYINDHESYRKILLAEGVSESAADDILSGLPEPFTCLYTLESSGGRFPDRYELKDIDGNKMNMNDLNGYQRGVVLVNAQRHFAGNKTNMYGIMAVMEVNIWPDAEDADRKSLG